MPGGEYVRGSVCQTAVEHGTGKKNDSGDDANPVQLAQRAANNVARKVSRGKNGKCSGRKDESEQDQAPNPTDE
jgi:hypothetical protein